MQKNLLLELLEGGDLVSLYSPKFEGEEMTEFEKFITTYQTSHLKDLQQIVHRLDMIKQYGAADRHFRYEGTMHDRVMGLPSHLESTHLRLYCLNLENKVLILGNGGMKTTRSYNEDPILTHAVETLQKIDIEIRRKESSEIVFIRGSRLLGELTFTIDE